MTPNNPIERLREALAPLARNGGYYKPEVPHFEMVEVPLEYLRRAHSAYVEMFGEPPAFDDERALTIPTEGDEAGEAKCASCGFPWGMDPVRHAEFCDDRRLSPRPPVDVEGLVERLERAGASQRHAANILLAPSVLNEIIAALRQPALPEGEEAQPIAWRWRYMYPDRGDRDWRVRQTPIEPCEPSAALVGIEVQPLYAHPPALSQPPGMRTALSNEWSSIDDELRDGTEILLYSETTDQLAVARWADRTDGGGAWLEARGLECASCGHKNAIIFEGATHWRDVSRPGEGRSEGMRKALEELGFLEFDLLGIDGRKVSRNVATSLLARVVTIRAALAANPEKGA
jgi:hypothetical protein